MVGAVCVKVAVFVEASCVDIIVVGCKEIAVVVICCVAVIVTG